jgi:glucosamine--fructose-6-phosphate aminotransferase (isomerizing)
MCGIVGYTGIENSLPILVEGLRMLEYRGYDSAGVAFFDGKAIKTVKSKGKLTNLEDKLEDRGISASHCGIGHTRWATHGAPSDINSHPHSTDLVAMVHN